MTSADVAVPHEGELEHRTPNSSNRHAHITHPTSEGIKRADYTATIHIDGATHRRRPP
jgi:hypothetical protein